jgi:hypothetical protein
MPLFGTGGRKARQAELAAEAAERAAAERQRLEKRMKALLKNKRAAAAPATSADLRRWPRAAGFNAGTALFDSGWEAPCRIHDRGFGGMRIEFSDERSWPNEFALSVPTLRFFGIVRSVWKNGQTRGVEVIRWRETP